MKLRKIICTTEVELVGEKGNARRILIRKPGGLNHLEDLGVDGDVILNRI
jgi:hypothetical protein